MNRTFLLLILICTAQKVKFFTKDFFSKFDQIRRKLRICSHLLKKSWMENFIFCRVMMQQVYVTSWGFLINWTPILFLIITELKIIKNMSRIPCQLSSEMQVEFALFPRKDFSKWHILLLYHFKPFFRSRQEFQLLKVLSF